jgi:23S rRNA (pseudouridine1915-N3)-methyltransferase
MKIKVIWVGKTKELFIGEGIRKYSRLIKPYAELIIREIKEEKGKDIPKLVMKEGERIVNMKIPYVLLDEGGRDLSSVKFAEYIDKRRPALNFVVGGPFGVSETVKETAQDRIALSKMTFTHEMARLFLLEQVYRALTIIHKRGYHH